MKPGKAPAAKKIVGGVKVSLPAKKERPFQFKEERSGDSSSSSNDDVLEEQVHNFSLLITTNVITVTTIECVSNWIFLVASYLIMPNIKYCV